MKYSYLIILCLGLFLVSCGSKKAVDNSADEISQEVIEKIEKENVELENLEGDIESDIKEIDDLLKEVEDL